MCPIREAGRAAPALKWRAGNCAVMQLENLQTIFTATPKTRGTGHYGSRLLFAADGSLFITTGDRRHRLHDAQDPSNHLGTVLRLNDDGSTPADNPFISHATMPSRRFIPTATATARDIALRPLDNIRLDARTRPARRRRS